MDCVICNKKIVPTMVDQGAYGFNPAPVKIGGRCCGTCDDTVVIPYRIKLSLGKGMDI